MKFTNINTWLKRINKVINKVSPDMHGVTISVTRSSSYVESLNHWTQSISIAVHNTMEINNSMVFYKDITSYWDEKKNRATFNEFVEVVNELVELNNYKYFATYNEGK